MFQFDKIKLVIWDLDETFWQGTLSEEDVVIPEENRKLIVKLTDVGIVNSICSKNDWKQVKNKLEEESLMEYFVFPSVNWEAKGNRVKQLISDMKLRNVNVLFIDDNVSNREEVRYFCPDIMVAGPEEIQNLITESEKSKKKDLEHKRLKQYRILEEKFSEKVKFSSNKDFLMSSDIRVTISNNCMEHLDRIFDLVWRANQLNFTKIRDSKEELEKLLLDKTVESGYVYVTDRFGDYGIVGFYALKNNELIHFLFSCRTLGMGIEQYTYNYLGRPKLTIVGEVISNLSEIKLPEWINQNIKMEKEEGIKISNTEKHLVLIKGPCDMLQIFPYIKQSNIIDTEFTFVSQRGVIIESTSHTTHMVEALTLSEAQKSRLEDEVPFIDKKVFKKDFSKNSYKVVFTSILQDANLGVYKRKETGEKIAFLEYSQPITDSKYYDGYLSGKYWTADYKFTQEFLEEFSEKYEYIGRNTPEQVADNLRFIRQNMPKESILVVMLGGELEYQKNTLPAYRNRHIVHKEINDAIRKLSEEVEGILCFDVNKYLKDQTAFYDHFNHYIKPIYYKMAEEMVQIINQYTEEGVKQGSKFRIVKMKFRDIVAALYHKILHN